MLSLIFTITKKDNGDIIILNKHINERKSNREGEYICVLSSESSS
jgi:hypothetical protein